MKIGWDDDLFCAICINIGNGEAGLVDLDGWIGGGFAYRRAWVRAHRHGGNLPLPHLVRHFGGSRPKDPPPPPPPPQRSDAEIQAEKAQAMAQARRRRGRQSTILAGEQSQLQPLDQEGKQTLG